MARQERIALIRAIEEARNSKLISYVMGDRPGVPAAQIGEDAVRPMYDHLRSIAQPPTQRIDLFLYSRGGSVEVPWRIVSMFREHCDEFNVLIPYKAHSAATMIALGADHIIMGRKGELGPIDPSLNRTDQNDQTVVQTTISVEDVMAYIAFVKERAGLSDQAALAGSVAILSEKLTPWVVGSIYRAHSHIRLVATKLLASRRPPFDERRNALIVEALTEKMYAHGHAIGRREAQSIELQVEPTDDVIEEFLWQLYEEYETMLQINNPLDIQTSLPDGQDQADVQVNLACIESAGFVDMFGGQLKLRNVRQMPPQLNLNLNLNLPLPPGIQPEQLPPAVQAVIQNMLGQAQVQINQLVQAEVQKQAPVIRTEGALQNARWARMHDRAS